MKKEILLNVALASLIGVASMGCSASFSTNSTSADTKSANTTTSPAAKKDDSEAKKSDKPKTKMKASEKPEGTAKTAKKGNPIPEDWIYIYDERKGYGFYVPDGTTGETETFDGIDVMGMTTPAPSEIDIFVLAYKNKELSKEDLLNDAVAFLEGLGQKVTPGKLKAESDDYAVADATTVLEDGSKGTLRILVGTDVTDNYVMILGTDPSKFAENEKIIDEIWGGFEMWSGGASNN